MYSGLGSRVLRWKLERNIVIGGHTKKSDKNNKVSKRLQLQGVIGEIKFNFFTRKKGELISIEFLIMQDIFFFYIYPQTRNLQKMQISKSKSVKKLDFFFFFFC